MNERDINNKSIAGIRNAKEQIAESCKKRIRELYGESIPNPVSKRFEQELTTIVKNGFVPYYYAASVIVREARKHGYPVRTGRQMAASFILHLLEVTDINPIPQHYFCPDCGFFDEVKDSNYGSVAFELEDRNCPGCGKPLRKDGHNIPFEVYLGAHLNRKPDIVIHVAPEVQAVVFAKLQEIFEGSDIEVDTSCIIPDDTLSLLYRLAVKTDLPCDSISMSDPETLKLFFSGNTEGIPVFEGEKATMLLDIAKSSDNNRIPSFGSLMRILALSNGIGRWTDDARRQEMIANGRLDQVIVYRDEVYSDLLNRRIEPEEAENVAEWTRKGILRDRIDRGRVDKNRLILAGIDEEYIEMLLDINYLLSKPAVLSEMIVIYKIAYYYAHYKVLNGLER